MNANIPAKAGKRVAIIQARVGSTRLPGKVLLDLAGKTALDHMFGRVKRAKTLDEVWLATTDKPADDVLEKWAVVSGFPCFRGSEQDVLERYLQTARRAKAEVVIRVTSDCPLMDPAIIDLVVSGFLSGGSDYTSNVHPATYPDGQDVEVFSLAVLERAGLNTKLNSEHEHVTAYIWKHPEIFKIQNISHEPDLSAHRWTLDTPADYELLKLIFEEIKRRQIFGTMEEVLEILKDHPQWSGINSHIGRYDSYQVSLKKDQPEFI